MTLRLRCEPAHRRAQDTAVCARKLAVIDGNGENEYGKRFFNSMFLEAEFPQAKSVHLRKDELDHRRRFLMHFPVRFFSRSAG